MFFLYDDEKQDRSLVPERKIARMRRMATTKVWSQPGARTLRACVPWRRAASWIGGEPAA